LVCHSPWPVADVHAGLYEQGAQGNTTALLAAEIVLLSIGIFLTFKAYGRPPRTRQGEEKLKAHEA